MDKITAIKGNVIPLKMNDVDTDLIIPAQYLTSVSTKGYGEHLFQRLKESDKQFVFNQTAYQGANILLTGNNFGCGSSREHAVWALREAGIQAIIGHSFADIFASNSAKNGLLLITLSEGLIADFFQQASSSQLVLYIDVVEKKIRLEGTHYDFDMDPFVQYCFTNGLDELDYLLSCKDDIGMFKQKQKSFLTLGEKP